MKPYQVLANWYDWVMAHVEYEAWGTFITDLVARHELPTKSILELAAGTCRFGELLDLGQELYVNSDLNMEMLNRSGSSEDIVKVAVDARAIPFLAESFDFVLMIYDSFNYLMNSTDVAKCLEGVSKVLKSGGHFLFDVTTEHNSKTWFDDVVDVEELEDCLLIRKSYYYEADKIQKNYFTFFQEDPNGSYRKFTEEHQQRVYSREEMFMMIEDSPLELVAEYSGFSFLSPDYHPERIQYLLRKN